MDHKTLVKGSIIGVFGYITGMAFGYFIRLFIGRAMGPEVYGNVFIGYGLMGILVLICLLGMNMGITRFVSYYKERGDYSKIKSSIKFSLTLSLTLGFLLGGLLFIFSETIAINIYNNSALINVFKVFAIGVPFSVVMWLTGGIFQGYKDIPKKLLIDDVGKNVLSFMFIVGLFLLGFNLMGAVWGMTLGYISSAIIGVFLLKSKILKKMKVKKRVDVRKELIKLSLPLMVVTTLGMVLAWIDVLMMGYFDVIKNVGIYSAMLDLVLITTFVLHGTRLIFLPTATSSFAKGDFTGLNKIYKTTTSWIFLLGVPFFIVVLMFPENMINLFFGSEYLSGATALRILATGYLFFVLTGQSRDTIMASGNTKMNMWLSIIMVSTNVILNFVLIPIYGMVGAAIAMASSLILYEIIAIPYVYKNYGIWPWDTKCLGIVSSGLVSVGVTYVLFAFSIEIIWTLLASFGFFIFYIIFLGLTKSFAKEDLDAICSIINKVKPR